MGIPTRERSRRSRQPESPPVAKANGSCPSRPVTRAETAAFLVRAPRNSYHNRHLLRCPAERWYGIRGADRRPRNHRRLRGRHLSPSAAGVSRRDGRSLVPPSTKHRSRIRGPSATCRRRLSLRARLRGSPSLASRGCGDGRYCPPRPGSARPDGDLLVESVRIDADSAPSPNDQSRSPGHCLGVLTVLCFSRRRRETRDYSSSSRAVAFGSSAGRFSRHLLLPPTVEKGLLGLAFIPTTRKRTLLFELHRQRRRHAHRLLSALLNPAQASGVPRFF